MTSITILGGSIIVRDNSVGVSTACCCPPPPPPGCCCVEGQYYAGAGREECEECIETYECYIEAYVDCDYVEADESEQCPEGYTPDGFGWCEQCGECPPGTTPAGFGYCFGSQIVDSCDGCEGQCFQLEKIGLCGGFANTCEEAQCPSACCFCVSQYVEPVCETQEPEDEECPEGFELEGEECVKCECPEGFSLSESQFGTSEKTCISDEKVSECFEARTALCRGGGGVPIGTPTCEGNDCAERDCCQPDPCPPECEESQWPEEIEVTLTGMPDGFGYSCNAGCGRPDIPVDPPPGWGDDIRLFQGGSFIGVPSIVAVRFVQDGTFVLQRASDSECDGVTYSTEIELEVASSTFGQDYEFETFMDYPSLSISRDTRAGTFLTIETPEGGFGGGAEGIVVDYEDGAITGVRLCSGGNGYARLDGETVEVSVPNVVITSNTGGEGAEITAQIEDDPQSAIFGQVKSLTITSGGSGYGFGGYRINFGIGGFPLANITITNAGNPGNAEICDAPADISEDDNVDPGEIVSREECGIDLLDREYTVALGPLVYSPTYQSDFRNGFRAARLRPICNQYLVINDIKLAVSIPD